jgi:protein-L-isoaspartate(D-aspartate) O-methyltransferase
VRLRFRRRRDADASPGGKPTDGDAAIERARAGMVADQLERRGIKNRRVLDAMAAVPREAFVPGVPVALAYDDRALPIDAGQTISQPYMVARMTELLGVEPGDRILEVGTGSGYQAAVLAHLGAIVTTIERHPDLAEEAERRFQTLGIEGIGVRVGDGSIGEADGAPWDGIVVTAAAPSIPDQLREQLATGGRLVIPIGPHAQQELIVVERRGPADWTEWSDGAVVFVPLVGEAGWSDSRP